MATAVERFRERFRFDEQTSVDRRRTPDDRIRAALDLHAFNLLLTIDKVRNEIGDADEAAIAREVNRRRLASSLIPEPLAGRVPRRDGDPLSK